MARGRTGARVESARRHLVTSVFTFSHLGEEQRSAYRAFVESRVAVEVRPTEEAGVVSPGLHAALASSGSFARTLPVAYGGLGEGLSAYALQQEELARVFATASVATTWTNLSGLLLQRFGSAAQREEILGDLARGEQLGAVAWTEPHGGTDAASLRTTATRVTGGWVLNGAKRLIDNVRGADFLVVGAHDDASDTSLSMFLVRPDDPGFVAGGAYRMLGLRAAGVGWFELRDCFVGDDRLVGEVGNGLRQMMSMVEFGRTGVAAICLGLATSALEHTRDFLRDRQSFGRRLSENDVVLARLGDLRARLEAARLLTYHVAQLVDAGERCDVMAAMAKLVSSELALEITEAAVHLHGGVGLTDEYPVERHFRDSRAFTIGEGTSEIMRFIIGRQEFR